jgi:26S proteasome regulatory subunit N1
MAPKDKEETAVTVAAESDKKKDEGTKSTKKKDEVDDNENMSEEDRELKERLETCVSTVLNEDNEASVTIPIRNNALDVIVNELRTATSSMTSVPKPLKFLRPHFARIKTVYNAMDSSEDDNATLEFRARMADVLSVLAMTMGKPGEWMGWVRTGGRGLAPSARLCFLPIEQLTG